ncbi:MAG: SEL1-like repeat protein [Brucellaceae bacterium]|nr:SEL1-like repeat protein [Brucellaceae bacterium]
MKQRNSYLDSVNAGRRRRAASDFEAISSTLSGLEAELDRLSRARNTRSSAARPPVAQRPQPQTHPVAGEAANTALLGRINREIESLRAEMRGARPVNLEREVTELRHQLGALQSTVERAAPHDMSGEFDRLYERLDHLPGGSQDHDQLSQLTAEMDELKRAVATLAREDSLRAVEDRWNQFDERWDAFQDTMLNRAGQPYDSQEILNLADRIYNLQELVASLPETLPIGSLEQQIGVLARAIERMATKDGRDLGEAFAAVEERLDELSRAVVSSSVSNQPPVAYDFSALDRIEARVASLAKQFENGAEAGAHDSIAARIEALADKIDAAMGSEVDSSPLLSAFDERLQALHRRIEDLTLTASDGGVSVTSDGSLRSLETRLDEVLHRLDNAETGGGHAAPAYMGQIEERIQELADRLQGSTAMPQAEAFDALEARLHDITTRLDRAMPMSQAGDPPALANLEAQISDISHYLSGMAATQTGDGAIEERLTAIEQSLENNRDTIFEVARAAAENALSAFQGGGGDAAAGMALADDLKSLETLARSSDERNTKTFGAIHDTLLRIVDRIGALEETGAPAPAAQSHRHRVSDDAMPALEPDYDEPLPPLEEDSFGPAMRDAPRSPAEAAAAAARAAVSESAELEGRSGMIGGLTRALGRKSRKAAEDIADEPASEPSFDAPLGATGYDDSHGDLEDDALMEPGSGAPDLDAIMRRVRDDRGGEKPRSEISDSGRQDFLAAARRAAQAAAAEAAVVKRDEGRGKAKSKGAGKPDLKALAARHKKPLMMAAYAVLLAIAGWQLGKTFFADADKPTQTAAPAKQIERVVPDAGEPVATAETADAKPVRVIDQPDADNVDPNAKAASIQTPADDGVVVDSDSGEIVDPGTVADAPAAGMPDDAMEASAPADGGDAATPAASVNMPPPDAGPVTLREAAASGNAAAMFEIAARYGDGRNGQQDLGEAFKWYKMAAESGFAPAQYRLGSLYEKGIGVERDIPQAKTWYQMAAAQGNASAMHNLAVLFAMGADGTPDHESAVNWFTQAAEFGVKDSQYNLGILAANGQGMQQNLEESYKWFALAAKAGDKEAASKRDEVFKVLRPEQQQKARATTELWKPKPLDEEANTVTVPEEWRETNERTASVDMKKAIQNIQGILNKNGYDAGTADGVMGARTKAAIKAFEADSGLPVDGEVDDDLIKALLSKN